MPKMPCRIVTRTLTARNRPVFCLPQRKLSSLIQISCSIRPIPVKFLVPSEPKEPNVAKNCQENHVLPFELDTQHEHQQAGPKQYFRSPCFNIVYIFRFLYRSFAPQIINNIEFGSLLIDQFEFTLIFEHEHGHSAKLKLYFWQILKTVSFYRMVGAQMVQNR